jgi:ribosomal protein S12 methylthiotransferase
MNRRGNCDTIKNAIKRLREIEGMVIRSTAIVGFPGETEEEFLELCQFIREVKFEHFGAFAYSREEGTPAYKLPDQIDEDIKAKREEIIMREQQSVYDELTQGQEGKIIRVLTEGYDNLEKRYIARAYTDAPEIDDLVFYQSKTKHSVGDFVNVRIDEIDDHNIYATEI